MPELLEQFLSILLPAIAALLAAWFGVLGAKIKNSYEKTINTQLKKEVISETVNYVEQVYKTIKGEEKLQKAIEQASIILNEKGIPVSEVELKMLIESAVYGLNQGLTKENKEAE